MPARRELLPLLAAALCAAPGLARADGLAAQVQQGYANSTLDTQDETGQKTRSDAEAWTQRYRLTLDETLYPNVKFGASGLLDWVKSWSRTGGVPTDSDAKTWNGDAHLTFGDPVLSGGLDYGRREQTSETRVAGVSTPKTGLVRDTYAGAMSWRPLDLPSLDLRLSRTQTHDLDRAAVNLTSDEALLSSRFDPLPSLDLRYSARYVNTDNAVSGVRTTELSNSGVATWTDRFLGDRGHAYVGYAITTRNTATSTTRAGGTVATQRFPTGGLSTVEAPLETPLQVTLKPNAALVDGVLNASAGVNLGYNASAAPVVTSRDLGAQLADAVTRVTLVHVYVDKNVAPVAQQLTWAAYESDDNLTWTPLGVTDAVSFDPLQFRFEIPIQATSKRYVKVVTKPITRQLTTDAQFADIFVTELQLFDVVAASEVRGRTFTTTGTLNGTGRVLLLRAPALVYDLSTLLTHAQGVVTYSVVNGLSVQHRFVPALSASARVDRSDTDLGRGHESADRWSGSLSIDPFPTLGGTFAYSGQLTQSRLGDALSHTATALARADLYEGISTTASGSTGWANDEHGRTTRGYTATLGASIVPNRVLSTTESVSYTQSRQTGAGLPEQTDRRGIAELTASLSPYRTFSLSGSVVRFFGKTSSTLVNANGSVALFPGGDLQLRYGYQETLDTGADQRTRTHGPGLRWAIRQGWLFDAAYTFQHATSPQQTQDGQAFSANLLLTFR